MLETRLSYGCCARLTSFAFRQVLNDKAIGSLKRPGRGTQLGSFVVGLRVELTASDPAGDAHIVVGRHRRFALLIGQRRRSGWFAGLPHFFSSLHEAQLVGRERSVFLVGVDTPSVCPEVTHASVDLLHAGERVAERSFGERITLADLLDEPQRDSDLCATLDALIFPVGSCHGGVSPCRCEVAGCHDSWTQCQGSTTIIRLQAVRQTRELLMGLVDPPLSEDVRDMVGLRVREARSSSATRETVTIEWRGAQTHIDVISMPVNLLSYNPGTHRVRAQLDYDAAKADMLKSDPWGEESQSYLHYLLKASPSDPSREDPDFLALMDDIKDYGQKEPGIITPNGVLVNGNTRRAALRELGRENIRVGVLPNDWAWQDIEAVELELQLRKEHRRDYSYVNQLLAIDDETSLGLSESEVSKKFRIQAKTFRQARWVLAFIREAIARSKVTLPDGTPTSLRMIDFEDHQEKLKELQRKYVDLAAKDQDAAERMKEHRLLAIVLGKAKTDIRWIEPDFRESYLEDKLDPELRAEAVSADDGITIPGLNPDITVPDVSARAKQARATADMVLKAKAIRAAASKLSSVDVAKANAVWDAADKAVESSLDLAGRDGRLRKRKTAAPEKVSDANDLLKSAIDDVAKARSQGMLDDDALDDALQGLRDTLARLAQQASRGVEAPGEGLRWLQHAAEHRS